MACLEKLVSLMSEVNNTRFHVLLASYKGQDYLVSQVESILTQTEVTVSLQISDDESAQNTQRLLEKSKLDTVEVSLTDGPHLGVNANFLSLIKRCVGGADFYAFSDQDDVWLPNKLSSAKRKLSQLSISGVKLYVARTMVCDEKLTPLFLAKDCPRALSFKNALIESVAGGNTMVFSAQTLALLQKVNNPVHHDWLAYMVVTACGGEVVFDDVPYVLYRQHASNVVGANKGFFAKWQRFRKIVSNDFRGWTTQNIVALESLVSDMTSENRKIYFGFKRLHELQGWHYSFHRLYLFHQLGLYRQRHVDHLCFMLAAFLGKI